MTLSTLLLLFLRTFVNQIIQLNMVILIVFLIMLFLVYYMELKVTSLSHQILYPSNEGLKIKLLCKICNIEILPRRRLCHNCLDNINDMCLQRGITCDYGYLVNDILDYRNGLIDEKSRRNRHNG